MVAKTYILKELNKIKRLYDKSMSGSDRDMPKYYSKLALLELCGWIEESMDDIIVKSSRRSRVKDCKYINDFIERNHGFSYKNFRNMIISLIGITEVERVENKVNKVNKQKLESSLKSLKSMRDNHAHTTLHGEGSTKRLWAPSIILSKFNEVYEGLVDYENHL